MSRPGGVTGSIRLRDRFGTGNRQRMVFFRGYSLSAIRCCLILSGLVMLVGFAGAYSYTFQTTDDKMQIKGDGSWHSSPWSVDYWPDGQSKTVTAQCSKDISGVSKYVFTSWSGKTTSKLYNISINTGWDTAGTYTANYKKQYRLDVSSIPYLYPFPESGLFYDEGKTVHLTAPAVDGYSFDKWLVGGKGAGTNPSIDITMDNAYLVIAKYKATTGSINVASTPSGASVYLDGSSQGQSPMTIASVSPGTHTIKLTVSGYEDCQQSVKVVAGQTTPVNAHMMVAALLNGSGIGVYRPSIQKFILKNGTERTTVPWGLGTDIPVTGDWNGDGLTDVGVYRPSTQKFILKNGTSRTVVNAGSWSWTTDIPVTGDWNGDGLWDVGVWRNSTKSFYLKNGTSNTVVKSGSWSLPTDIPVTGDWNGDGLTDVGVYRPSNQKFILKNGTSNRVVNAGSSSLPTDIPVTSDWNGDGLWDVGVWRNSTKSFYLKTGTSNRVVNAGSWSLRTDIPVTGKWS